MALPSQTERNNDSNRSVMAQPGGGDGATTRILLVVLGLGLLAGGIYAFSTLKKGETPKQQAEASPEVKPEPTQGNTAAPGTLASNTEKKDEPLKTIPFGATPQNNTQPTMVARQPGEVPPANTGVNTPTNTAAPANTTPATPTTPTIGSASTTPSTPTIGAPTPAGAATTSALTTDMTVLSMIEAGDRAMAANKPVEARAAYSRAILSKDAADADKETLRGKVAAINQNLLFSPAIDPADWLVESYKVQPGDSLVRIRARRELATDYRLIQRVNKLANPNNIRVGQTLKLVKGPFHAVVTKSAYRVDIFAGSPDDPANWVYIKSYRCGLGEDTSQTPVGNYIVKRGSKLENPPWVNPRTGERFGADDPKNPIGEYWVGWLGLGESKINTGYGFHGTIEPDSIGQNRSMGCVRLGAADVAEIFELMAEEISVVRVLP
jgi:hypothetical protein